MLLPSRLIYDIIHHQPILHNCVLASVDKECGESHQYAGSCYPLALAFTWEIKEENEVGGVKRAREDITVLLRPILAAFQHSPENLYATRYSLGAMTPASVSSRSRWDGVTLSYGHRGISGPFGNLDG